MAHIISSCLIERNVDSPGIPVFPVIFSFSMPDCSQMTTDSVKVNPCQSDELIQPQNGRVVGVQRADFHISHTSEDRKWCKEGRLSAY